MHVARDTGSRRRLWVATGCAAVLVAGAIWLLPPFGFAPFRPLARLLVTLVEPAVQDNDGREVEAAAAPTVLEPAPDPFTAAPPAPPADPAADAPSAAAGPAEMLPAAPLATSRDAIDAARQAALAAHSAAGEAAASPSPVMDGKRRRLAGQYKPPSREPPKKIWENVETDPLGRTVLRAGNCTRILDDPNVTRRYQFETFDQYVVTCLYAKREPVELPWVEEIRERYAYLKYPDGTVTAAEPLRL